MVDHDETSPLLASSVHASSDNSTTSSNEIRNQNYINGHLERRNDEESHDEEETRERPYEGLPEVRKQLKFILPAVAIGASSGSRSQPFPQLITARRYSWPLQIRPLLQAPMGRLAVT